MSAQHTPGPWAVFDHYCGRDPKTAGDEYAATRLVGLAQFSTIAEVRQGHDDIAGDVDANARLIAAAPEMLEVLRQYVDDARYPPDHDSIHRRLMRAEAVIAKATGMGA